MKTFNQKWGSFCEVLFGPGSVLFFLLTIVSLVLAFYFKNNTLFSTLLAVLGSVFAGVAGGFVRDDYNKLASENVLEKKGRSALRNLEAISEQIIQIRKWIESFKNVGKEGQKALDETDRHLSTIMLNITAGIADWIDVVPELQERAEVAKKQEEVLKAYIEELLNNKKELIVSKDEKRVSELKEKISDLEKQIKSIRKKSSWSDGMTFSSSGGGFGGSFASGSFPTINSGNVVAAGCVKCGNFIPVEDMSIDTMLCKDCQKQMAVYGN